jgi:hypothetical protein
MKAKEIIIKHVFCTCPKALTQCRFPVCIPYKTTVPKRIEVISEWILQIEEE